MPRSALGKPALSPCLAWRLHLPDHRATKAHTPIYWASIPATAVSARIRAVLAITHNAYRTQAQGYVSVVGYYPHWPDLFPQHGPGKKHERAIALEAWQQAIVDSHPWEFIRGLIHSDGCRITNWTTRLVRGERKRHEYPRYFFTNVSDDLRRLFTDTLDKLGIEWTLRTRNGNPFNISIARKASVALLDTHVGPKH